jgi:hypothetical protein
MIKKLSTKVTLSSQNSPRFTKPVEFGIATGTLSIRLLAACKTSFRPSPAPNRQIDAAEGHVQDQQQRGGGD